MFMAEYEVDALQSRFDPEQSPNLHAGARALERLMDWTNGCSDGWAYWTLPQKAATKLMDRLREAEKEQRGMRQPVDDIDAAELGKLLKPIRSFLIGRKADPKLLDPPPPGRRTVTAVVRVTIEPTADVKYGGDDLADEIRDRVFRAVTEGVPYDVIVMTVEGSA